jgi:ribose transport system substrate-binding protein
LIGQQADAIMTVTQSGTGFEPLITEANANNIPYTNYSSNPAPGAAFNILYPHFETAEMECEAAAKWLEKTWNGEGEAGISSIPTDPGFVLRDKGCEAGLKKVIPDIKISTAVDGTGGTPEGGAEVASNLLSSHPEIKILYGVNDAVAEGMVTGARTVGRTTPESLYIGNSDAALNAFENIKNGTPMQEVVTPNFVGNNAVWLLMTEKAMLGEEIPKSGVVAGKLVNSENVEEVIRSQEHPFGSPQDIETTLNSVRLYKEGVPPYSNENIPSGPGIKNYWGSPPKP